jgi:hypothetical protein
MLITVQAEYNLGNSIYISIHFLYFLKKIMTIRHSLEGQFLFERILLFDNLKMSDIMWKICFVVSWNLFQYIYIII